MGYLLDPIYYLGLAHKQAELSLNSPFKQWSYIIQFKWPNQSIVINIHTTSIFVYLSPNFYCSNFDHTFFSAKDF
jgi:hypothetical protein